LIALLIVFQPELRSMLEKVGGESLKGFKGRMDKNSAAVMRNTISEICVAAEKLSVSKTGALIVLERTTRLGDVIKTGTVLDATPSAFLLCNIFYDKAPLHDGAVIIRNSRIYAAGCFLTLSTNPDIIKDLGTRHRAAIGMSENSDAVVIVVSEETGLIGVAVEGDLKRGFSRKTLEEYITPFLISEQKEDSKRHLFGRKGGDGDGDDSKE
ncbi:MAG: DNA integrity scanning protein DisA nucleotide-binding domain protein, partial [Clostridia bacterium]